MKFFLVDVVCITGAEPREQFDKDKVEKLANSILESDGLLKPLILKSTGPESFEIIDGHWEYWAAVRAREKDPRKGEMVNTLVVSPKVEKMIVKQLHTLQSQAVTYSVISPNILQSFEEKLKNINRNIDVLVSLPSQLTGMIQKLEGSFQEKIESVNGWLKQLEDKLPDKVKPGEYIEKKGYAIKTVPELKRLALQRNIKVPSKLLKSNIIALLEEYDKKNETKTS